MHSSHPRIYNFYHSIRLFFGYSMSSPAFNAPFRTSDLVSYYSRPGKLVSWACQPLLVLLLILDLLGAFYQELCFRNVYLYYRLRHPIGRTVPNHITTNCSPDLEFRTSRLQKSTHYSELKRGSDQKPPVLPPAVPWNAYCAGYLPIKPDYMTWGATAARVLQTCSLLQYQIVSSQMRRTTTRSSRCYGLYPPQTMPRNPSWAAMRSF